jgi:tripartite-type tricarboxylate transporter receptor subunit TctC
VISGYLRKYNGHVKLAAIRNVAWGGTMKLKWQVTRSAFVAMVLVAATPTCLAQKSQTYPNKPIRIVTSAAGSQSDIVTRLIGAKMSEGFGQPVVVENRAGAGGAIGANAVAKATGDGYTLLLQTGQFAIRAALQNNLPYDPHNDFAGVSQIGYSTQALVLSPSLGVKSVKDFISLAKAKPDQMLFSSTGTGTGTHMDAERFRFGAGIKARHVAFKGSSEAMLEIVAGRTHFAVLPFGPVLPLVNEGRLVALAVNTQQRSSLLPDVPTMAEVLPGYRREGSYGLMAPAGTPLFIRQQIATEVRRVLDLVHVKEQMRIMGFVPSSSTPEEHDRILRADIEAYTKVAKLVGLRTQ